MLISGGLLWKWAFDHEDVIWLDDHVSINWIDNNACADVWIDLPESECHYHRLE